MQINLQIASARRPLLSETACGDQADYWQLGPEHWLLCLADGLGHGPLAEQAAQQALACVASQLQTPLPELFEHCNRALRGTRGVAMSVVRVEPQGQVTLAGIGNIQVRHFRPMHPEQSQRFSSNYGIVGAGYRQLKTLHCQLLPGDLLLMHSDGISERFELDSYASDLLASPALLAERLLADWGKTHDDAAVIVCHCEPLPGVADV